MSFPYLITNNSVVVTFHGTPKTILKTDSLFPKLIEALKAKDWEAVELFFNPAREEVTLTVMARDLGDDAKVESGSLFVKLDSGAWWKCPSELGKHIVDFFDQGLPVVSWISFAKKLSQNPSFRSVQQLFQFLNAGQFTICEDGDFIAYKRVRQDFLDCYTGTFDNSPGQKPSMQRNEVDENQEEECSYGLHVAHWDYAKNSYRAYDSTDKLVYVKVNPADVVAVPQDYESQKMRVCMYEVLGECDHQFAARMYSDETGFYGEVQQYQAEPAQYEEWASNYDEPWLDSDDEDQEPELEDDDSWL